GSIGDKLQGTLHAVDDLAADRQAQAGTGMGRCLAKPAAIILVKDAVTLLFGNARTVVGDLHAVLALPDKRSDRHRRIRGVVVLDRIGDQVDQDLAQPVGVGGYDRGADTVFRSHRGSVLAGQRVADA